METTLGLLGLFFTLTVLWLRQRYRTFSFFKDLGVPGPPPTFLWGNLQELNAKGIQKCVLEWYQKYGEVFGVFFGTRPFLVVADPEKLKLIQVKDASKFYRKDLFVDGFGMEDERSQHILETLKGQKWKSMRQILSPSFSSARLKQMVPLVNEATQEFLERLRVRARSGEEVNIGEMLDLLIIDFSFRIFTGLKTEVQAGQNSGVVHAVRSALDFYFTDAVVRLALSFPWLSTFLYRAIYISTRLLGGHKSNKRLFDMGQSVYYSRLREKLQLPHQDVLQILIDYNKEKSKEEDGGKKTLLEDEIVANMSAFIFVAFDTESTLLLLTCHFLMYHPEVQERARDEARQVLGDKLEFDQDDLNKLQYIDQVLSEVLRLYPPSLIGISRRSKQDYHLPGLTIPKEVPVIIALPAMHYSPKFWTEPHKFDPDRFSPERRSTVPALAYQPFGAGPRTCIAMKLALLASRLIVARLLCTFRLRPGPHTDKEFPEIRDTILILHPKNDVMGIVEPL